MLKKTVIDKNYRNFSDSDLIELLFSEEDRLEKEAVDEIVFRGEKMIKYLASIAKEKYNWEREGGEWWAPIHAVFILGAIGGEKAVNPLIAAMRLASSAECDWVTEKMPSIFGKIGLPAAPALRKIIEDKTNDWFLRSMSASSLAAVTLSLDNFEREKEIFDFLASILRDESEDDDLRGSIGSTLLDFGQKRYCKSLLEFAENRDGGREPLFFDAENVLESLNSEEKDLFYYSNDWLEFYAPAEIASRQKRWKEESSWLGRLREKIREWKLKQEIKAIKKEKKNMLPPIRLKYFSRNEKQPHYSDVECETCRRKNIPLGGMVGEEKFICEDCAAMAYKKEHKIKNFAVAKEQRRRIFDVGYLFKEMVIDKYLAEKKLSSIDGISHKESERLFRLADETYNNFLSKDQKIILENTREQKNIEKELMKILEKIKVV